MIDNRPCPANLQWNENLKRCQLSSPTCPKNVSSIVTANEQLRAVGGCIKACEGLRNGNYPSCTGCEFYATCSNGILVDNRPCSPGLFWDDRLKKCDYSSSSCSVSSSSWGSTDRCVRSCEGMPNGDYQSCQGCKVYVSCYNGAMHDNRPCPNNLVWDDLLKRCEHKSTTCPATTPLNGRPGGPACVKSCKGIRDGHYHSCNGCHVFASCTNGFLIDNRPCPANLVWHEFAKSCMYFSSTCPVRPQQQRLEPMEAMKGQESCVSSCVGVVDGDYASCLNCSVYASCVNERLIDGRPCPPGLLWDDRTKACSLTSSTCTKDTATTTTVKPVPSSTPSEVTAGQTERPVRNTTPQRESSSQA